MFNYNQRKTTDSYRKGWEKVFENHTCKKPFLCSCEIDELSDDVSDRLISAFVDSNKEIIAEPTEQKQHNE